MLFFNSSFKYIFPFKYQIADIINNINIKEKKENSIFFTNLYLLKILMSMVIDNNIPVKSKLMGYKNIVNNMINKMIV